MKIKFLFVSLLSLFSMAMMRQSYDIAITTGGSGNYTSIRTAISAVPGNSSLRTVI